MARLEGFDRPSYLLGYGQRLRLVFPHATFALGRCGIGKRPRKSKEMPIGFLSGHFPSVESTDW